MQCGKCGATVAEGQQFCARCGAPINQTALMSMNPNPSMGMQGEPMPVNGRRNPKKTKYIIAAALSCAILLIRGLGAAYNKGKKYQTEYKEALTQVQDVGVPYFNKQAEDYQTQWAKTSLFSFSEKKQIITRLEELGKDAKEVADKIETSETALKEAQGQVDKYKSLKNEQEYIDYKSLVTDLQNMYVAKDAKSLSEVDELLADVSEAHDKVVDLNTKLEKKAAKEAEQKRQEKLRQQEEAKRKAEEAAEQAAAELASVREEIESCYSGFVSNFGSAMWYRSYSYVQGYIKPGSKMSSIMYDWIEDTDLWSDSIYESDYDSATLESGGDGTYKYTITETYHIADTEYDYDNNEFRTVRQRGTYTFEKYNGMWLMSNISVQSNS